MRAYDGGRDVWVLINFDAANASTFATPDDLRGERKDQLSGEAKRIGERLTLAAGETLIF